MNYQTVIGLEVHVQLQTATKIFCSCPAQPGGEPNTRVCPVCLGLPGTLPVLNRRAVELAVRAGLVLNCSVSEFSKFDRKNYFYPDLPKAYQISQYDRPLNYSGWLEIVVDGEERRIGVTRAHLEEDAGKLVHFGPGGSGVDYNRTGMPLLEIVSDPDLRSPREAGEYLKELRSVMRYIGASDCDMEKGSFRCDANISLKPSGARQPGVKVEIKNLNSFKAVERALEYEEVRQRELLERGEPVLQETRLFDADRQLTSPMRSKEEAHDYRYFPDPDLVPIVFDPRRVEEIRGVLPELPLARRRRFRERYGLPDYDAGVLTAERGLADYFESAAVRGADPKALSNWMMGELLGKLNESGLTIERSPIPPARLAALVSLVAEGKIGGPVAKRVFAEMFSSGGDPAEIVEREGLGQISDRGQLEAVVEQVISENPGPVADFRGGKPAALGFLVGRVMKATGGQANPGLVNQLLRSRLS